MVEIHLFSEAEADSPSPTAKWLADPDVVHVPVSGLLDRNYLAARSRLIDPKRETLGMASAGRP